MSGYHNIFVGLSYSKCFMKIFETYESFFVFSKSEIWTWSKIKYRLYLCCLRILSLDIIPNGVSLCLAARSLPPPLPCRKLHLRGIDLRTAKITIYWVHFFRESPTHKRWMVFGWKIELSFEDISFEEHQINSLWRRKYSNHVINLWMIIYFFHLL